MIKRKLILLTIFALILATIAAIIMLSLHNPLYPSLKSGDIIVGIGDSLTAGGKTNEQFSIDETAYFDDMGNGYFNIVADELQSEVGDLTFYNSARSGSDAPGWIDRVNIQCLNWSPDIVIITLGANDFLYRNSADYKSALNFISDALYNSETKVVMILPFAYDYYLDYGFAGFGRLSDEMLEFKNIAFEIATAYDFEIVDIGAIYNEHIENGTDPKDLSEDGIHPTDLGAEILAEAVLLAIAEL